LTNCKFLSYNYITGSSQLGASSGTASLANLIDRDPSTKWTSSSEGTDGTSSTITWTPSGATTIDRLFLKAHNFEVYEAYYNGGTANTFTPPISVTGGTGTNAYHEFGTVSVTSVTVKATNTITANQEKSCGEFFCGTQQFEVANNPDEYTPTKSRKGYDIEMADGGVKSLYLDEKYKADLRFRYVKTDELARFNALYDGARSFYFMPTPTVGTAWDGDAWEVNWVGDRDTLKLTGGIMKTVGYDVNMSLWEIAG
jgi:hypothetical protein